MAESAARPGAAARQATVRSQTALLASARGRVAGFCAALVALAVSVLGSLAVGSLSIPLHEVLAAFTAFDDSDAHVIVRELRVPRTEVGLVVGGALGAAGALMQGVTRNPLAEPGILGINAGAAFAVVLAIFVLGISSVAVYTWFALVGAGLAALMLYGLAGAGRGGATPIKLALSGAVLTALLVALTSAVLTFDTETLAQFRFWIVGSIAGRDAGVLLSVAPFIGAGLIVALLAGRWLNALALGDDVARSLGQSVGRTRAASGLGFVLLAGGAVAAAGPISFVGLTVPHVARALVGPDYRWIVPFSIVLGAILLLIADVLGRIAAPPGELQVGIVTAVLGAPFFIWLVRQRRLAEL